MAKTTAKPPALGARVRASGYMVRRSTMGEWLARDTDRFLQCDDAPLSGFKTWQRRGPAFSGVYVGLRVLTIKHWWWVGSPGTPEADFRSHRTPITFWLIAYSHRAKPRYVLPRDVEVLP